MRRRVAAREAKEREAKERKKRELAASLEALHKRIDETQAHLARMRQPREWKPPTRTETESPDGIKGTIWHEGDPDHEHWNWHSWGNDRAKAPEIALRALEAVDRPATSREVAESVWRLAGSPGARLGEYQDDHLRRLLKDMWYRGSVVWLVGDRGETFWTTREGETAGLALKRDADLEGDLAALRGLVACERPSANDEWIRSRTVFDAMSTERPATVVVLGQALGRGEKRGWVESVMTKGRSPRKVWRSTSDGRARAATIAA